ncbi:MAG: DUF86 domain-containing protein [Flavobacteriales bacterium]|nr:DUF86 domain-containing protein [Flavobacteriales bacterium]
MSKNPLVYIRHIQDCIVQIMEYTSGMTQEEFLKNRLVQDAVIRNFEVIGEATKNLDEDFRKKYPHVEWKKMAGMRDKLIHDYIGVDVWAVWRVVENVIPDLQVQILKILNN